MASSCWRAGLGAFQSMRLRCEYGWGHLKTEGRAFGKVHCQALSLTRKFQILPGCRECGSLILDRWQSYAVFRHLLEGAAWAGFLVSPHSPTAAAWLAGWPLGTPVIWSKKVICMCYLLSKMNVRNYTATRCSQPYVGHSCCHTPGNHHRYLANASCMICASRRLGLRQGSPAGTPWRPWPSAEMLMLFHHANLCSFRNAIFTERLGLRDHRVSLGIYPHSRDLTLWTKVWPWI
ncbi:hypothetical protein FN846DRAFT_513744 [Sphaerosporella brunnea]|uniref:Uncharacterized protein n=1 Tax=Sphaerosporella brunnea TaxID=1250544 RepID=A0A5J5EDC6_9PEZI|nr:hypothetical protein FN846DRAFT_513744 [Sphaerosporella brunnea]